MRPTSWLGVRRDGGLSRPVPSRQRVGVSFIFKALLVVAIGTALGLWATAATTNRGFLFGAVASGPWSAYPTAGSPAIDPYARAAIARSAYLPIGTDEGLSFVAARDDARQTLDGRCSYAIESGELPARFWTLGLYDRAGRPLANPAGRYAMTSQDVVRVGGRIAIAVAPEIRPGNWLLSPATGPFVLVLVLYEANGGTAANAATDVVLPTIRREGCRP